MAAGEKGAVIPMQMMMRNSKKRIFPVQMLRRLLPGSMPRRLHKTHHYKYIATFSWPFFDPSLYSFPPLSRIISFI